ncbi:MAG: glycosyltransferase family 4 protein [Oscillospiraceae bacterium]
MKKVLWVSHTTNFVKFNKLFMMNFLDNGWQVDYASAEEQPFPDGICTNHYKIPFSRSPYSTQNIKAYKQLKKIIIDGDYDLIHCHTPIGGVLTRLVAKKVLKGTKTKVIYTSHGFHFYKGAPLLNWLIYYPVEKILSKYTDCLVTINDEDYNAAIDHKFKAKKIARINSVGVDIKNFVPVSSEEKTALREELGFSKSSLILNYSAELNANKNQEFLFNCVEIIKRKYPNVLLLLCGYGEKEESYRQTIKAKGLEDNVLLLGYRADVAKICQASDICAASSIREGLSFSVIEALSCGEIVVATSNRGHKTIIKDGVNGFLIPIGDTEAFSNKIMKVYEDGELRKKILANQFCDLSKYDKEHALTDMNKIYEDVLGYSVSR